jgi:hypothetical protein
MGVISRKKGKKRPSLEKEGLNINQRSRFNQRGHKPTRLNIGLILKNECPQQSGSTTADF